MDLTKTEHGTTIVVSLPEPVELEGEPSLEFKTKLREVIEGADGCVVVDLGNVGFVDSQGLGALISAHKLAVQTGGRMIIANLSDPVASVLRITRLIRVFEAYLTVDEAVAATAAAGVAGR